jgi:hypothetical protein
LFNWDGKTPWTVPGVNEILIYFRAGSNFYAGVTHNFISGSIKCPSCDFRTSNGIMSVGQSGKFAAFSSDMLLQLGNVEEGW